MNVGNKMTKELIMIQKDISVTEARDIMKKNSIHRLPVVNSGNELLGIVTEKDLLYASPSPASTLDVYEMGYLLNKLKVNEIMTKDIISVSPELSLEDAARIMADNNIGGLPVCQDKKIIGIITESDLFKIFVELFAARQPGLRVTALLPQERGELAKLSTAISNHGGDIVSFGNLRGESDDNVLVVMKIQHVNKDELLETIKPFVLEIKDVQDIT